MVCRLAYLSSHPRLHFYALHFDPANGVKLRRPTAEPINERDVRLRLRHRHCDAILKLPSFWARVQ